MVRFIIIDLSLLNCSEINAGPALNNNANIWLLLQIEQFMGGLSIAQDGIIFPHERLGRRSTGEAYIFFTDGGSVTKALEKNKQNIQHR